MDKWWVIESKVKDHSLALPSVFIYFRKLPSGPITSRDSIAPSLQQASIPRTRIHSVPIQAYLDPYLTDSPLDTS